MAGEQGTTETGFDARGQALDVVAMAGGAANVAAVRHVGNCIVVGVGDPSLMTEAGSSMAVGGVIVMEEAGVPAEQVVAAIELMTDIVAGTEDVRSTTGVRDENGHVMTFEHFALWEWRSLARRRQSEIQRLERDLAESRAQVDRLRAAEMLRLREAAARERCEGVLPERAEAVLGELEERVSAILDGIRTTRDACDGND